MLLRADWVTTVDQSADQIANRIRQLVIDEKYFSDRRGQVLFHGVVSRERFALVPCVVEVVFGSIQPYPVCVQGRLLATESGTRIEAHARLTDIFYLGFGFLILALVAMFAYAMVLAPSLILAWIAFFLPGLLLVVGVGLLYARMRLRITMTVLQEGVIKP